MYMHNQDSGTGSIFIKPVFMFLTTAAATFAQPNIRTDIDFDNYDLEIIIQSGGEEINPYYSLNGNNSFYDELTHSSHMDISSLVEDSYNQIQELGFLIVNEEMDKEIDSYFAKINAKKTKKVILIN